jgi:hypothetical protein
MRTLIAGVIGSLTILALFMVPARIPRLSHQRKRLASITDEDDKKTRIIRSDAAIAESRCAFCIGDWCTHWTRERKQKLARPLGEPPTLNKPCLWDCNGVGVCDYFTGKCRCSAGWQGDSCEVRMDRPCSQLARPRGTFSPVEEPFLFHGPWRASMCAGECDLDYGACFCPSWTAYGRKTAKDQRKDPEQYGRPMGLNCQPSSDHEGKPTGIGSISYDSLFGPQGWCQSEKPEINCNCGESGDGLAGDLCEIPVKHACVGQNNGHGKCNHGFYMCEPGWTGQDCSMKVDASPSSLTGSLALRPRPLIYVYDMPPRFDQHMLQYKLGIEHCIHRLYDENNATEFLNHQYTTETGLHELLLQSSHRTLDPEEADFFYVPVYTSCWIMPVHGYAEFPYFHGSEKSNRVHTAVNMLIEAQQWVQTQHPYWDRNGGKDHILFVSHDEGSCWVPQVWRNATILSHWGYEGLNNKSYTSYDSDMFDQEHRDDIYNPESHLDKLGLHQCHDRKKDLVLPVMKQYNEIFPDQPWLLDIKPKKDIWGFHLGRTLPNLPRYSNGTRQAMTTTCKEQDWWEKYRIYVGEASGLPEELREESYSALLSRSTFCFALMGEGWTTRFDEAIAHQCIPVIIIDDTAMSFEGVLDVGAFAIRVPVADIPRVPEILKDNIDRVRVYQERIAKVHSRFQWSYERFMDKGNRTEDDPPDAFDTLLGWLHSRV